MKYLFIDIECANCFQGTGKICEFGFVLTDEQFNEIDRRIFVVNPKSEFDWYVVKNMLAYRIETYKSSPDYPFYFDKIQALFTDKETLVLGHTTDADIKYLNDEAERYSLPFFNCKFYDAKFMYNLYAGTPNKSLGVSKICEELGISTPKHEHKSVDDAYATMLIVKEICSRMQLSVLELVEKCEDCRGETCEGKVTTVVGERARKRREELEKLYGANIKDNMLRGDNKINFLQFLDGVQPQGKIIECELTGKKISVSLNYEYAHFKEMLSIVQLLKNRGCDYSLKASLADYFVTCHAVDSEGNEMGCSRLKYVNEAIANGANIKIITLDELFVLLGTTPDELVQMPFPEAQFFVKKSNLEKKQGKRPSVRTVYSSGSGASTLGDLLAAQGTNLSDFASDDSEDDE